MEQRKFVVPEVIMGSGSVDLVGQYLSHFRSTKTMIVTDTRVRNLPWFPRIIESIASHGIQSIIFDAVSSNPKDFEAMLGSQLFLTENCDSVVAVGGGSPIDCAKCICVVASNGGHILDYIGVDQVELPGPPLICIPSTAGSSADVSQFAIIADTNAHLKKAIISKKIVPDLALIDTVPLMTMDSYLTACTGMDALTHAIEAYVSNASSPITDIHALKAIKLLYEFLPEAICEQRNEATVANLLLGSLHAGFAFSNASLGAVHALAHSLGGIYDLPHGECNSILLEHIIELNFDSAKNQYMDIAEAIGLKIRGLSPIEIKNLLVSSISELRSYLMIPNAISKPLTPNLLEKMCNSALNDPCMITNPKSMSYEEVKQIYVHLFQS